VLSALLALTAALALSCLAVGDGGISPLAGCT
jgi:hypothetical protein